MTIRLKPWLFAGIWLALLAPRPASAIMVLSQGMVTPESISVAPAGFGGFGGMYLVPDAGFSRTMNSADSNIYAVPALGGTPSVFANNPASVLRGGLFLPDNWGSNAGKFATVGDGRGAFAGSGVVFTYDASGRPGLFQAIPNSTGLSGVIVAPGDFGPYGGQLLITDSSNGGRLLAVAPDGTTTTLVNSFGSAFGITPAPVGFGAAGGRVLVSDSRSGAIVSIDALGTITPFGSVPLAAGQSGLRQLALSPADFLPGYGSLLFASVSGSSNGGGTLGDIVALDSSGAVVASLRTNLGLTKFDPRGLHFRADGSLLISDTSDPILIATRQDFQIVPEPSSLLLLGAGLASLVVSKRRGIPGRGFARVPKACVRQG